MAEVEVSPQEEMANPQGMKVFVIERYGLPKVFVSFRALLLLLLLIHTFSVLSLQLKKLR